MDLIVIDSESESYTETSDSEDQDEIEFMYGGHAQNILSSLDESIGKIDDFLAFERGFLHGDIVCSVSDPSGQLGRVVDVDMVVDLETSSGDIIKNVNSKKLSRMRSFVSGDYVVMGPWIGRVIRAFDMVIVLFNDGAKCEILVKDTEVLKPIPPSHFEDAPYFYYPGQRVTINLPTISKSATWSCGSWRASRDEGTVCHADVGLVHVNWITSVTNVWGLRSSSPHQYQEPKNLTLLSCFPYANWQLGDWCTLPADCSHSIGMDSEKSGSLSYVSKNFSKMQKCCKIYDPDCSQTYVIIKTRSNIDVLWQNGNLSVGLDPQTVVPVSNLGDHDFWPEQFVLEKATSEDVCATKCQHTGVVRDVDALERTVKVKWMVSELKDCGRCNGSSSEETVSAYELVEHPDFSYCIGEVVVRSAVNIDKSKADITGPRKGHDLPLDMLDNSPLGKATLQVTVANASSDNSCAFFSCIGNVVGHKDEGIDVRWANGLISKVRPFEIIGLQRLLDASIRSINEESVPTSVATDRVEQEKLHHDNTVNIPEESSETCAESLRKAAAFLFPKTVFGVLANIAVSLFGSHGSTSSGSIREDAKYQIMKPELQSTVDDLSAECLEQPTELVKQIEKPAPSSADDKPRKVMQFDVMTDCSDHHFAKEIGNVNARRGWLKKIQQEWSILQNDLPDSIYVRVYEERMDLLRACIVGAAGTPYHDNLFFFDIFFPPAYPHEPPAVYYHSGGLRLNPNLYESGKVCLSLLKTWTGSGTEVWNSESSTVLQVLLSLQALVLNEKPYFNEAGYDKQIGKADGEKNSITYNENAFLLSCKSMIYLLHKPPKHFEKLVKEHFTCHAPRILDACKAYLGGSLVGHAHADGCVSDEGYQSCSTGFKIMLAKLLPKLVAAFAEIGIDCDQSLDQDNRSALLGKDGSL